jgi:type VI secretion system secreted protein VgrG
MEITTPLGDDVLLFHGMHAREEMSRVARFNLSLLSLKGDIVLDDILGKNVTVKVALADDSVRCFNGYVTRFAQRGKYGRYHRYFAEVRPWLWFLSRTADCRIFQQMTVPDILKKVFDDEPTNDVKFELTGSYRTRTYCVQYRETDLNFASRLMEEEGIGYYVKHSDGHNTLVLTDSLTGHEASPGYETIPFVAPGERVRPELEHVSSWEFQREVQPGVYVHDDYDFERPSVDLKTQKARVRTYQPSTYEVYDYPGYYAQRFDGEASADVRIDEYATQFESAEGVSNARGIRTGALFTLTHCARADQDGEYLVVATSHDLEFGDYEGVPEAGAGSSFRCTFVVIPSRQQFRPQRLTPKPFVQGPQTAVVVGPAGEEIYTDEFGRVKVQFHWDREGQKDENSSCWMRVSHPWAGKGWGSVATPRIGQEVIVDFLEGDPDQPMVTGRVYNAECQPPFGFPAGAVVSGIKSQTHKGAGYNEISADDTAGKEKVTIHGQYDMNTTVEHDQTTTVHNNRTDAIDVDDSETVGANQTISVGANQSISVGADRTLDVAVNETISVGANQEITIGANQDVSIAANQSVTVGADRTVSIAANDTSSAAAEMSHSAGANLALAAGADLTADASANVKVSAGAAVEVAGGSKIVLSVGGATIEMGPAAITLTVGGSSVKVDPAGVTAMGPKISLN